MAENSFDCYGWGGGTTVIQRVEARAAADHRTVHRAALQQCLILDVSSPEVETPSLCTCTPAER